MSRYLNQLLALVAVAEQRSLEPEEAARLRQEIEGLCRDRRKLGGITASLTRQRAADGGGS